MICFVILVCAFAVIVNHFSKGYNYLVLNGDNLDKLVEEFSKLHIQFNKEWVMEIYKSSLQYYTPVYSGVIVILIISILGFIYNVIQWLYLRKQL